MVLMLKTEVIDFRFFDSLFSFLLELSHKVKSDHMKFT